MIPVQDVCASFQFTTDGLTDAARAKKVRELRERATVLGNIEPIEPLPDCPVRADITKTVLPGLGVMSGMLCGLRQAVRPKAISGGEDDLFLGINLSGSSIAQQNDQELILRDGDAVLATRGLTGFTITRPTAVHFLGFRLPRSAIVPLVARIDDAPIQIVPHGTETLNLLSVYARAIVDEQPPQTSELQPLVAAHLHDLIAATVDATQVCQAVQESRGIRAARLRAIMADITANLCDCDLTVAALARRQRLTPRYVHKLFESVGLTFSAFVLARRLARAHRMLSAPAFGDRTISSVAFDVGFGDLSYFNRAFRRRYGATPSDIRQSAQWRGSPPR